MKQFELYFFFGLSWGVGGVGKKCREFFDLIPFDLLELLGVYIIGTFFRTIDSGQIKFFEDVVGRFMLYIFIQDVTCRINRSYPLSLGRIFMDISVLAESLFGLVLGHVFLGSIILGYCIFLFGLFQKGIQLTLCNGTQNHDFVRDFPLEPPEAPPQNFPKSAPKNEVDIFMNTWCLETFWLNIRNIWECLG